MLVLETPPQWDILPVTQIHLNFQRLVQGKIACIHDVEKMNRDTPSSPTRGSISHAQWLRKQFSGTPSSGSGESGSQGGGEVWPDLLVDRRTVAEKRIIYSLDTLAIERNNIVSIR